MVVRPEIQSDFGKHAAVFRPNENSFSAVFPREHSTHVSNARLLNQFRLDIQFDGLATGQETTLPSPNSIGSLIRQVREFRLPQHTE